MHNIVLSYETRVNEFDICDFLTHPCLMKMVIQQETAWLLALPKRMNRREPAFMFFKCNKHVNDERTNDKPKSGARSVMYTPVLYADNRTK
jgi:hypothetical protein